MNYRIIPIFLVKSFERCIVTWTAAIVARNLKTAIPRIDFIRQCNEKADLHFDGNLLGLCTKGGEQIYVLRDMGYNYSTDPPGVVFQPDTSTSTVSSAGYLNFELVYSGVTKDSVRLLYREYTQQDLVRPAFSQDVVYERDASTIRFRNVLIRVLQATGEQIRFVVLEDGYPPQK